MPKRKIPAIVSSETMSFAEWMRSNGKASDDVNENMFAVLRSVIDTINLVSITDPE